MGIANNLKYLRRKYNYDQGELADKLQIKQAAISAYETGRNEPKIYALIKLSMLFGVTIDDLINKDLSQEVLEPYIQTNHSEQLAELKNQIADLRAMVETQKQLIEVLQKNQKE